MRSARSPRSAALTAGSIALAVYLATTGGSLATTDAVVTYEVTKNLLLHRTPALLDERLQLPELRSADGRYFAPFGIGQSLYNVPFYLAGHAVRRVSGIDVGDRETIPKATVAFGTAIAAAGTVALTWLLAWRLSGSHRGATVAAAALAFGSALWPYSKFGFNAPLTALCLTGAVYAACRSVTRPGIGFAAAGGAILGAGLLTRHELIVAVPATVLWTWWAAPRERLPKTAAAAAGPAAAVGVWLWYNAARFGDPFFAGHRPAFDTAGLAGLLFAPGGSLFLYSPVAVAGVVALLGLWRSDRRSAALLTAVSVSLFGFYALLEDWLGTRSYGPRYLVPLLPLLLAPLAVTWRDGTRTHRALAVGAVLLGAVVQLPGILVDPGKANVALGVRGPVTQLERRYDWDRSALRINATAAIERIGPNIRYLLGFDRPPKVDRAEAGRSFSQQFAFSLDFWWLYAFYLGILPRALAMLVPLVLLALTVSLGRRLRLAAD